MATSIPFPFKAQIPVTPPPEYQMFMKGPPPQVPAPFSSGIYQTTPANAAPHVPQERQTQPPQPPLTQPPTLPVDPTSTTTTLPSKAQFQPPPPYPTTNPTTTTTTPTPAQYPPGTDPRHIAMASRIASYYQQRCQAMANFQQQRCQAWAAAQRQKCQEMMQAATVIVAWYIRDRIARRRKRKRRAFRRGLACRAGVGGGGVREGVREGGTGERVTKGEAVRRWVMGVPIKGKGKKQGGGDDAGSTSTASKGLPADKEERDFDMDREVPADKDTQLFSVADNLIKSHLARVDVPLLGVLSFDESESESESEDDFMDYEEDEEEDDDEYEDEGEDRVEVDRVKEEEDEVRRRAGGVGKEELASASKDAQLGTTTKGSRKRSHSLIS